MTESGGRDRETIRRDVRERLARGIYERERARDQVSPDRQASWEDLNTGRRATRLNYADELLSTLFGAFGLDWASVDAIRASAEAAREAGADPEACETAKAAAEIVAALLPRRLKSKG